jgi:hypothetical protein
MEKLEDQIKKPLQEAGVTLSVSEVKLTACKLHNHRSSQPDKDTSKNRQDDPDVLFLQQFT